MLAASLLIYLAHIHIRDVLGEAASIFLRNPDVFNSLF